ncbi:PIG-L family deacetylase [Candidatus Parcubacteria bacterium]|jgi:LmbE family N-acetylglucosaminyl deacetylase|nr:PIG-L family deacetylase [Candidatus Parcubacteria bacterium]
MAINNILCFAPHPDDEVLGCGGSIAKALGNGHNVYLCYLSFGENASPKINSKKLGEVRKKEALAVAKFLGIPKDNMYFLAIPDNQINHLDLENVKKIIKLVRMLKPDLVYLPHEREQSSDHAETNRLVMRALDMAGSNNFFEYGKCTWWVKNVLAYEVWTPLGRYQYTEDISSFIDKKISALKIYKSQSLQAGNISDFVGDKAKYLSAYRAAMTLGDYREAFQVLRVASVFDR